jgi:hypothetical protein
MKADNKNRRIFLRNAGGLAAVTAVGTQCSKTEVVINNCCNAEHGNSLLSVHVNDDPDECNGVPGTTILDPRHGLQVRTIKGGLGVIYHEPGGASQDIDITVGDLMYPGALDDIFDVHPGQTFSLGQGDTAVFIVKGDQGLDRRPVGEAPFADQDPLSNHSKTVGLVFVPGKCSGQPDHVDFHIEC